MRPLTISKVARILGVPVQTLRVWCRKGKMNGYDQALNGWRYWNFADLPEVIDQIAEMLAQKPSEHRTKAELAALLRARYESWKQELPCASATTTS